MSTFTFGRYKGSKVEDIIKINPYYVKWASENVSYFKLNKEQEELLTQKISARSRIIWEDDDYEPWEGYEADMRSCFDPNY